MSTLSNVDIMLESAGSERVKTIEAPSGIIPDAINTRTGVSVSYIPHPDKKWFVLRASYGRALKAVETLTADGTFTYTPMHTIKRKEDEKQVFVREPLLPSLVFAYTTAEKAKTYVEGIHDVNYLTYYYDHFRKVNGKNPPLVVDNHDMEIFIKATLPLSEHIRIVDDAKLRFKSDERVIVTDGIFKGVEGRVARISGQQRVAVTIKGVCTVVTAYVPSAFLKKLETP